MKELLAVLAIALGALAIYKVYETRFAPPKPGAAAEVRPTRLSEALEPLVATVLGPINARNSDLATALTTIKERVVNERHVSDERMRPIYSVGQQVLEQLIPLAVERTRLGREFANIESNPSSLDNRNSAVPSNEFFRQGVIKRWDDKRKSHQIAVDRLLFQLRNEEKTYVAKSGGHAPTIDMKLFDVPISYLKPKGSPGLLDRGPYR